MHERDVDIDDLVSASRRTAPAVTAGPVARTLIRWFMHSVTVTSVQPLSHRFRLLELHSDAFKTAAFTCGQKLQILVGQGLTSRTYTPVRWDQSRGTASILVYTHDDAGPGGRWGDTVASGDTCQMFGPRNALTLASLPAPLVLLGDETSFGQAVSLREAALHAGAVAPRHVFEVASVEEAEQVLQALGLEAVALLSRAPDDAHLVQADSHLRAWAAQDCAFVLTGRSAFIQRMRRQLKTLNVLSNRIVAKVHWAPGRKGLD